MKKVNIISSHSDTMELPDGTKIKVICENYDKPLYPHGPQLISGCKIDYVSMRGTRWVGPFFETHQSDEEMMIHVNNMIEKIKENPNNYKHEFAPK